MADRHYNLPENPVYKTEIRMLETSDPAHADTVFNPLVQDLVNNTHHLKKETQTLEGRIEEVAEEAGGSKDAGNVILSDGTSVEEALSKKADLKDGKVSLEQLPEMDYDVSGSAAAVQSNLSTHAANTALHVNAALQNTWNAAATTASAAQTAATNAQTRADSAYTLANTANTAAVNANTRANNAYNQANSAYNLASAANTLANTANVTAAAANTRANNAYNQANSAYTLANSANTTAVTANTLANSAYMHADNAYDRANTAYNASSGLRREALALGVNSKATGIRAVALGTNTSASGNYSVALGVYAESNAIDSVALGRYANASGVNSMALGVMSEASGINSTALGHSAKVSTANTIQLGSSTYISTLSCRVALTVTSDERDKTDIKPIDSALEFISQVETFQYVYNQREKYIPKEEDLSEEEREKKLKYGLCAYDKEAHAKGTLKGTRKRVGVRAQQVQKALITTYGAADYANLVNDNFHDLEDPPKDVENQLGVTYEAFIPFLIRAVQELSDKVKRLEGKHE